MIETDPMVRFVKESWRIEGLQIDGWQLAKVVQMHHDFCGLMILRVSDLENLAFAWAGASLRDRPGMDVYVGDHRPPRGGPEVETALVELLFWPKLLTERVAYQRHQAYENLHPFMDCNGRTGRALWLWIMLHTDDGQNALARGFLHSFYYQALQYGGSR